MSTGAGTMITCTTSVTNVITAIRMASRRVTRSSASPNAEALLPVASTPSC
jgi:hypothetical protein